ncbi:hypothetical protein N431DRAFT_562023 [Stipitochalara longipes BDJ]|nr:hypothetical protein N431DRAFT_562023 [Stipitochalara longipes BDJ]
METPCGQHIGQVNLQDGLVHGIDGLVIGLWDNQPLPLTPTTDNFTSQSYALPTPNGFQVNFGLDTTSQKVMQPSAIPSYQSWNSACTSYFQAEHGSSTVMWSPSPNTSNWQAKKLPSQSSLGTNNSWNWDPHNNVTEGAWVSGHQFNSTAIHPEYATPHVGDSMSLLLNVDVHNMKESIHTRIGNALRDMSSQSVSNHADMVDNLEDMLVSQLDPYTQGQATVSSVSTVTTNTNHSTPSAATNPQNLNCHYCMVSFKRSSDRIRHERTIHAATYGVNLCPVIGCPRSQGAGYSRADKVTEHLWKKHGNLGYVKAA